MNIYYISGEVIIERKNSDENLRGKRESDKYSNNNPVKYDYKPSYQINQNPNPNERVVNPQYKYNPSNIYDNKARNYIGSNQNNDLALNQKNPSNDVLDKIEKKYMPSNPSERKNYDVNKPEPVKNYQENIRKLSKDKDPSNRYAYNQPVIIQNQEKAIPGREQRRILEDKADILKKYHQERNMINNKYNKAQNDLNLRERPRTPDHLPNQKVIMRPKNQIENNRPGYVIRK